MNTQHNNEGLMASFGKVAGINLGLMLLYSMLTLGINPTSGHDAPLAVAATMAMFLVVHFFVLLVVSIALLIAGKKSLAKSGFLSLLVVLLVGFGTCIGLTSVVGA